jgi:hypothetical protein
MPTTIYFIKDKLNEQIKRKLFIKKNRMDWDVKLGNKNIKIFM